MVFELFPNKYFNDTIIFTFGIPASLLLPVVLYLNLNDLEFVVLSLSGSSLKYCHKLAEDFA